MPAVIGDGLKPLKTSHRPSDSSHTKIGTVAITARTGTRWSPRNSAAVAEAMGQQGPRQAHDSCPGLRPWTLTQHGRRQTWVAAWTMPGPCDTPAATTSQYSAHPLLAVTGARSPG